MNKNSITSFVIVLLSVIITACANKEDGSTVFSHNSSPDVVGQPTKSRLTAVARQRNNNMQDSLVVDSIFQDGCYRWNREYTGCTHLKDDDGSIIEMNILINLQEPVGNIYHGGLILYTSETNFVEAVVLGEAEGNHITIYYVENDENTTGDLFKHHDKLVTFKLEEGEYQADWYQPMHDFVNETTIISIN